MTFQRSRMPDERFKVDMSADKTSVQIDSGLLMKERTKEFGLQTKSQVSTPLPNNYEVINRMKQTLDFKEPEYIYGKVISDSRTLPKIPKLEQVMRNIYSDVLMRNVYNIQTHSVKFYSNIVLNKVYFELYQRFIYLLSLIAHVFEKQFDEIFINMDPQMGTVIEWSKTRKTDNIYYLLEGPKTNSEMDLTQFVELYKSMISPSNKIENVTDYLQLCATQDVKTGVENINTTIKKLNNAYDKVEDKARKFIINVDTNNGGNFSIKLDTNDLLIDCQQTDIGDSLFEAPNLNYLEAEVQEKFSKSDSKISSKKITNLMNKYSKIKLVELLIMKSTYQTPLDIYDKVYIEFPNLFAALRTNSPFNTGTLQIPGRFAEDSTGDYWNFMPSVVEGIAYKNTTADVKRFDFRITVNPLDKADIVYNNFGLTVKKTDSFNCPIVLNPNLENDVYILELYYVSANVPERIRYSTYLYDDTLKCMQLLPDEYLSNITSYSFDLDYVYDIEDIVLLPGSDAIDSTVVKIITETHEEGVLVHTQTQFINHIDTIFQTESSGIITNTTYRNVYKLVQNYYVGASLNTIVGYYNEIYNFEDNLYKAFHVDYDILDQQWLKLDFVISLGTYLSNFDTSMFLGVPYNDLGMGRVTDYSNNENYNLSNFKTIKTPKFYKRTITSYDPKLIIYSQNHGLVTDKVLIHGEEYIIQVLNENMILVNYCHNIDKDFNLKSMGSRAKMIMELL